MRGAGVAPGPKTGKSGTIIMAFRDLEFRKKILLNSMFATTLALVLACATFLVFDYFKIREASLNSLIVAADILGRIEIRLLGQQADARPRRQRRLAGEPLVQPSHDAQQRRFARPVHAKHPDLRPG